jgi:hypothetical protein
MIGVPVRINPDLFENWFSGGRMKISSPVLCANTRLE